MASRRLLLLLVFLMIFFDRSILAQGVGSGGCALIDFETLPGETAAEGLVISTQFEESLGMSFELEDGTFPRLAEIGTPTTAFEPNDTPALDQDIGSFFLTDDGELAGSTSSPLLVTFSIPVDSAHGVVLDIDFTESFTIEARDADGQVVEQIIIEAGDEGTGDALATPWSFRRATADVASIRFEGMRASGRFGLGFDNFETCAPARVTSVEDSEIPENIVLHQNYPNPFNPSTRIEYEVLQAALVRLEVYSMLGRRLTVLVYQHQAPGRYQIDWAPQGLASGTYLYRLTVGNASASRHLTVLK